MMRRSCPLLLLQSSTIRCCSVKNKNDCKQLSSVISSSCTRRRQHHRDHCNTIFPTQQQQRRRLGNHPQQATINTPPYIPSSSLRLQRRRRLTISQAFHLLQTQQITSQQLCQHAFHLANFGEHSLHLNAYVKLLPLTDILHQAQSSNERIRNGQAKSLLDGIPVTIKANIAVGKWWMMPNSSSAILNHTNDNNNNIINNNRIDDNQGGDDNDDNAVYESDIARKLLTDCGAVLIGITNMDEFGMGSLGLNSGLLHTYHHHHQNNNGGGGDIGHAIKQQQHQGQNYLDKKQYCRPIYNPLPWMYRLAILEEQQQQQSYFHQQNNILPMIDSSNNNHDNNNKNEDRYWIDLIQNSTMHNPHGILNEDALEELLDEVRYWTQIVPSPQLNDDDDGGGGSGGDNNGGTLASSRYSFSSSPLLSPGGSSSGAAVTIAHGSSLLSIGTDTGGSLRLPSAWTTTVGFKPTYGTFSRYGVVSYASSLDTVGFVTGSVDCARIGWECLREDRRRNDGSNNIDNGDNVMRRFIDSSKSRDATARVYHDDRYGLTSQQQQEINNNNNNTKSPLANIRIGIPNAFSLHETPPLIADAWSAAANTLQNVGGATLVPIPESLVSSEWMKLSCAAYYVLACAEASSNLSRYDGVRFGLSVDLNEFANLDNVRGYEKYHPLSEMTALEEQISTTRVVGFGDEVQRRVLAGTSVLSSDRFHTHYEAAAVVRAKVSQSIERAFRSAINNDVDDNDKVDVMLVPTALSFPCTLNPKLGDRIMDDMDPTAAFGNDVMTIPISLGGFPSISVPFPTNDDNLDRREKDVVGLQVFGMRGSEDIVLQVANIMNISS
ncbi:hypothetical protein ACHAXM_011586 [Skeletonema potamos]